MHVNDKYYIKCRWFLPGVDPPKYVTSTQCHFKAYVTLGLLGTLYIVTYMSRGTLQGSFGKKYTLIFIYCHIWDTDNFIK